MRCSPRAPVGTLVRTLGVVVASLGLAASSTAATLPAPPALPLLPGVPAVPPVAFDCSEDVTDAFNSWLAKVPDGSTIFLVPNGCYRSNGTIKFVDKRNVTVLGNGATIKASGPPACPAGSTSNGRGYCVVSKNADGSCPPLSRRASTGECMRLIARAQLSFHRGAGLAVRDLTVQGSNFTADCAVGPPSQFSCYDSLREGDGNLYVWGSDGVVIDNVHFKNAWGDAVQTGPIGGTDIDGNGAVMARNVTVQHSTVDTAGRHAFSCVGCRDFVVRDNTITNVGYWGVDVEVEAKTWTGDITLERNKFSNVYIGLLVVTPNGPPSSLGPIVVRDNVRTDAPVYCMYGLVIGRDNRPAPPSVRVTGNHLRAVAGGVVVRGTAEANVTANTFDLDRSVPCAVAKGIVFSQVSSGSIVGNTVLNANQPFELVESAATVCGNRTTASGPFDQPEPC